MKSPPPNGLWSLHHDRDYSAGLRRGLADDRLQQDEVYDVKNPSLAETLDCELWTADERLYLAGNAFYRVEWTGSYEEAGT